jgi:hypothetical protein
MKILAVLLIAASAFTGCSAFTAIQNIGNETYLMTRSDGYLYKCVRENNRMRCVKIEKR